MTSTRELLNLSLRPVKRALYRWYIRMQMKSLDRHIDHLHNAIRNDQEALRIVTKERIALAARLRGM